MAKVKTFSENMAEIGKRISSFLCTVKENGRVTLKGDIIVDDDPDKNALYKADEKEVILLGGLYSYKKYSNYVY